MGGMVIQLNNSIGNSAFEPFWDSSWLSRFPEEDERIVCGSIFGLQVQSVDVIGTGKSYSLLFAAFHKFDAMLSGERMRKLNIKKKDVSILNAAIASLSGEQEKSVKKLDSYAVDSFYAYTLNKTSIVLDMEMINDIKNESFINLAMNGVKSCTLPNGTISSSPTSSIPGVRSFKSVRAAAWNDFP